MGSNVTRAAATTLLFFVAVAISGCSESTGVTAFERDQTNADILPDGAISGSNIASDTSRFLVEDDDVKYFAAKSTVTGGVCLISIAASEVWSGACSSSLPLTLQNSGSGEVQLTVKGELPEGDGWRFVVENLAIRQSG